MISAMYENGGNTTHRLLDGHPQMYVYPFESQLGTRLVDDHLSSVFPAKYRWPAFALDASPDEDYRSIIDEETRVRARTPHVSKFRHLDFDFSDDERCKIYINIVEKHGRSRRGNVMAFFQATFEAWKGWHRTGREAIYVGYSPIVVVDAPKILADLPDAHVLHVVRNPWSAYADTRKRPVPLSLEQYMLGWTLNQYYAQLYSRLHAGHVHVLRAEDIFEDPIGTLGGLCESLGLQTSEAVRRPSWNGADLQEVYPWGTIRHPTPAANRAAASELSSRDRDAVAEMASQYLQIFDYKGFI